MISAVDLKRDNLKRLNLRGGLLFHEEEVQIVSGLVNLPVLLCYQGSGPLFPSTIWQVTLALHG